MESRDVVSLLHCCIPASRTGERGVAPQRCSVCVGSEQTWRTTQKTRVVGVVNEGGWNDRRVER